ncbi:hypothetical protein [Psychrobacter sp. FDAARGOS_221]|uniref:hypothetical protein n=1 Tax=Psychrobacter sp. FDAARGOS_221 TaxID=1975705 RepID=UPI000BB5458F|nr:hypothetical protein [Psychrobacter sp. FDAARGOS_221]PNK59767.1 hypothetical protein A6J60_001965 [Psychrobacter sp. FDAARGOS_221]
MTALLPTRVSIYDFLFEDTQPIDALLADQGNISLPQARILVENGIQAIISGLLAYHQNYGADAVLKKLLSRSQIKELRKHNAFNLDTMHTAMQHGQNVSDALFESVEVQKAVCKKLGQLTDLSAGQVRPLLGALSILCLREIAILADFAQLDASELDTWFKQQPQFLHLDRKIANLTLNENICDANAFKMPTFDINWGQLTGCHLPKSNNGIMSAEQMPHYAKVIGRTTQTTSQTPQTTEDGQLIVDKADNSNILTFCAMDNIALPYQRWMLQLAKISDIYLSRNRLKVAPEPAQPPSRPFVSFGFLDNKTPETNNHSAAVVTDQNKPLWKNPVLILLVLVIGALSLLAVGKYQYKKSHADPAEQATQKQPVTKKPDSH